MKDKKVKSKVKLLFKKVKIVKYLALTSKVKKTL